jgi:hypothetical protein
MAEKYFAKLERQWEQTPKTWMQEVLDPYGPKFARAKSLRGPDFAKELNRLAVLTEDARFRDALFALREHRIIDGDFNFLRWEVPVVVEIRKRVELKVFVLIYWRISRGTTLRRACAVQAVLWGWPAASFTAAIKDLELIYRRHRDRCFSSDEIEFMLDFIEKIDGGFFA